MSNRLVDRNYRWDGFGGVYSIHPSQCRLRIYQPHPEQTVVVFSSLDPLNPVKDCIEPLIEKVLAEFTLDPSITSWVNHLPVYSELRGTVEIEQAFIHSYRNRITRVTWQEVDREQVEGWISDYL
ncbi:MAG: hypothetical protein KME07_09225 [Pegethrix bostrychoides GSE-TBD4-15B]|jgi:hypothetical protein|uniref:Uncharacterized protein n=1 Tax=Pegethrix bostrychoides GSE-TBD4-15B TaxID=2839662 RepID=A0A951P9J2_9CYAN|nr:hypothetical protein [Pegethrix bostrychoides GSE-TBD4-15B]